MQKDVNIPLSLPVRQSKKTLGIVTNIQAYSLHDGPGIRTLVFMKGCPLRCQWCCNPECLTSNPEVEFYKSKCIKCGACLEACRRNAINPDLELKSGFKINKHLCNECGDCTKVCPVEALKFVGRAVSVDDVLDKIKKDRPFYLTSKGGLTISGGEPVYQIQFTSELLKKAYEEGINTAIETCGNVPWQNYEQVLPYLDTVLYDVKHIDSAKHKQGTGSTNKLILSNLKKLSSSGVPIIIRLPLIPQFNLERDNILNTVRLVSSLQNVIEVNLLPFHQLGKDKYFRLGIEYSLNELQGLELSEEGIAAIKEIRRLFESYGLNVRVG